MEDFNRIEKNIKKDINILEKLVNVLDKLVIEIMEEFKSVSEDKINIEHYDKNYNEKSHNDNNDNIEIKKHEDVNEIIDHDDFMLQQPKEVIKISENFEEVTAGISSILLGATLVRK